MTEETTPDPTLAVLVSKVEDLRKDVREIRDEGIRRDAAFVSRELFAAHQKASDERFQGQGREIAELKAARAPWWTVVGSIAALGALALSVVVAISRAS